MVEITREKIDFEKILACLEAPAAGGVVIFIGRVRNHARGKQVLRLEYEGYPAMAKKELEKIEVAARQKWPVIAMALVHRLGMLQVGEASVVIAVACAHRKQAFEACKFAIDRLKQTIPVWKKEYGPVGASWAGGIAPDLNNYLEEET